MTSLKSYSTALPRDISADRLNDRFCDRLSELAGVNGPRSTLVANQQVLVDANSCVYQPATPSRHHLVGASPRTTSLPYAVSSFCLRERDASHVSLQALARGPAPSAGATAPPPVNLVRSRSVDQEFMSRAAAAARPSPPPPSAGGRSSRQDSLIVDLQGRLGALSRECCALRVELERTRDQLHASTHSVRVFWSPELKRERSLRKDESIRLAIVSERLRLLLRNHGQVRDFDLTSTKQCDSEKLENAWQSPTYSPSGLAPLMSGCNTAVGRAVF